MPLLSTHAQAIHDKIDKMMAAAEARALGEGAEAMNCPSVPKYLLCTFQDCNTSLQHMKMDHRTWEMDFQKAF